MICVLYPLLRLICHGSGTSLSRLCHDRPLQKIPFLQRCHAVTAVYPLCSYRPHQSPPPLILCSLCRPLRPCPHNPHPLPLPPSRPIQPNPTKKIFCPQQLLPDE